MFTIKPKFLPWFIKLYMTWCSLISYSTTLLLASSTSVIWVFLYFHFRNTRLAISLPEKHFPQIPAWSLLSVHFFTWGSVHILPLQYGLCWTSNMKYSILPFLLLCTSQHLTYLISYYMLTYSLFSLECKHSCVGTFFLTLEHPLPKIAWKDRRCLVSLE